MLTSRRLGFREWSEHDLGDFAELCGDPAVMEYFPSVLSVDETRVAIERLTAHQQRHGYCYFAVELRETREFLGFIGLAYQEYDSYFTPCVDIGWRLKLSAWGNGYATEGARTCLAFAFETLQLDEVYSTTPHSNRRSENVMQKIGMHRQADFVHPRIDADHALQPMLVYRISRDQWRAG